MQKSQLLGWESIPVTVVEIDDLVRGDPLSRQPPGYPQGEPRPRRGALPDVGANMLSAKGVRGSPFPEPGQLGEGVAPIRTLVVRLP
jgi:hypothetical protein